jgi:hypothetical protein
MKLKKVWLYRSGVGNDGAFKGSIEVDNEQGSIALNLSNDEVRAVLGVARDSLVRISGEAASRMAEAINDACHEKPKDTEGLSQRRGGADFGRGTHAGGSQRGVRARVTTPCAQQGFGDRADCVARIDLRAGEDPQPDRTRGRLRGDRREGRWVVKVILTIGHYDILLPDDTGLSTIMKALARGVECRDERYLNPRRLLISDPVRVKTEYLTEKCIITRDVERDEHIAAARARKVETDPQLEAPAPILRLSSGGRG